MQAQYQKCHMYQKQPTCSNISQGGCQSPLPHHTHHCPLYTIFPHITSQVDTEASLQNVVKNCCYPKYNSIRNSNKKYRVHQILPNNIKLSVLYCCRLRSCQHVECLVYTRHSHWSHIYPLTYIFPDRDELISI